MNILISGGTGFIGQALVPALLREKHTVSLLIRLQTSKNLRKSKTHLCTSDTPDLRIIETLNDIENDAFDVIINLAGEPIADKRWTPTQKDKIRNSRIGSTRTLVNFMKYSHHKPSVLISGSAIGYYGIGKSDNEIGEDAAGDHSFSSQLCKDWEAEALSAQALGIRCCLLRTGIVLGQHGGALAKMRTPFQLGLGGPIGSGKQWMPWIHIGDMIGLILFAIHHSELQGPLNATAPQPVTNNEFSQNLAAHMRRPCFLRMPKHAVKLLMGQMGEELLLSGKKVVPTNALAYGYTFQYAELNQALDDLF